MGGGQGIPGQARHSRRPCERTWPRGRGSRLAGQPSVRQSDAVWLWSRDTATAQTPPQTSSGRVTQPAGHGAKRNVLFTKWGEKSYQRHKIESILPILFDNFLFLKDLSADATVKELRAFYRLQQQWNRFLINYFEILIFEHLEMMINARESFFSKKI